MTAGEAPSINTGVGFAPAPQATAPQAYPTVGAPVGVPVEGQYYDPGNVIYPQGEIIPNAVSPGEVFQGGPINGVVPSQPVDSFEGLPFSSNENRAVVPNFVKQVSYDQQVPTTQRTTRRNKTRTQQRTNPRAQQRTQRHSHNPPIRDRATQAVQRLPRKSAPIAAPVSKPRPVQSNSQISNTTMNWESFGLSSPGGSRSGGVQANIKSN